MDIIGRITTDGTITEFPISNGQEPEGITAGADGNLWFTEPGANAIGRMTPQGVSSIFQITGSNPDPRGITLGPDGNVWYTELNDGYIGRVTPQGVITRFEIPAYSPQPWGIATGPDGDLWFTESEADAIGRFDPRSLKSQTSLSVPTPLRHTVGNFASRPTSTFGSRSVREIKSRKLTDRRRSGSSASRSRPAIRKP